MSDQHELESKLAALQLQHQALSLRLEQNSKHMMSLAQRIWELREQEQKKLATELHDGVGQVLTALVNKLRQHSLHDNVHTEELAELASMALRDVRSISRLMRPSILDDLGFDAAVGWLIRQFNLEATHRIQVDTDSTDTLPPQYQTVCFRVLQEAMTNIVKHAGATSIKISLVCQQNSWLLTIEDNGAGFELSKKGHEGVGLSSIHDRVAAYGGRAIVESSAGGGTKISAWLPPVQTNDMSEQPQ